MIKYIGFLNDTPFSLNKEQYFNQEFIGTSADFDLLVEYLKNGECIMNLLLTYTDVFDGEYIGPYSIYTDGEFVWPSYFVFYLEKYKNIYIDDLFLKKIKDGKLINLIDERKIVKRLLIDFGASTEDELEKLEKAYKDKAS